MDKSQELVIQRNPFEQFKLLLGNEYLMLSKNHKSLYMYMMFMIFSSRLMETLGAAGIGDEPL